MDIAFLQDGGGGGGGLSFLILFFGLFGTFRNERMRLTGKVVSLMGVVSFFLCFC